jgi:hypothetical protein
MYCTFHDIEHDKTMGLVTLGKELPVADYFAPRRGNACGTKARGSVWMETTASTLAD